jgi:predicted nucleic acid-binding protein
MSDRFFVDTNILMYAHDTSAGAKHERARALVEELWRDRTGVVSTQVLQELSVNLRRKAGRPLDVKATREIVADYLTWHVIVNSGESILEALDFEARYQVSFWDALVLHAAHASGADVLYSEDLSDGQTYGSVRVTNPFKQPDGNVAPSRTGSGHDRGSRTSGPRFRAQLAEGGREGQRPLQSGQ